MYKLTLDPPESLPRFATITIDRHGEKVNAIAPESFAEVEDAFRVIELTPGLTGVIIMSGKADNFIAGADVEVFARASERQEIEDFTRNGHRILNRIADSKVPVVAAVHGSCLGAGLEFILACTYRIASDSPKTVFGLPEVQLGLIPGGGGCSRLPRLVGLQEALGLILTGQRIRPRKAKSMGLIDQVVSQESLYAAACAAAVKLANGQLKPRTKPEDSLARSLLEGNRAGRALVINQARKSVERKTQGLYPAPLVALDIVARGIELSLEESLRLEPPAFAELALSSTSKALVRLFRSSNALKRQAITDQKGRSVTALQVQRLGIVGGGFMGADIAIVAAENGIETRLRDISKEPLTKALAHIQRYFDRRAQSIGPVHTFKARSRVSGGLGLDGYETMDLIIEAVPEVVEIKQDVYAQLEKMVPSTTILATNTSALPLAQLGQQLKHKDRFIGLHFFSPVPKMPLLEIVKTAHTSPQTIATCLKFATTIGKTPIVVNDGPGFYTSRVLGFYLMAALEMIQQGYAIEDIDRGARKMGWPVGPITLLDEVGIDVGTKVAKTLAQAFPDRLHVPANINAFVTDHRLGRKSKRGFYLYDQPQNWLAKMRPKAKKRVDPDVYHYFEGREARAGKVSSEELGERLTFVAALEAVRCLEEKIIISPRDGDVGAVFGFGYPPMRGGPFHHLDSLGLDGVLRRLGHLKERYGDMYTAPPLLIQLAKEGRTFSSFVEEVDHEQENKQ